MLKYDFLIENFCNTQSVDFAITDLTITAEREQAVDFTTPFMNLGISILFRKPQPPEPALLAFLLPFSNGVFINIILYINKYIGISISLSYLYVTKQINS